MKKIVSILSMLIILVSFASCGSDQKQEELKVEKPEAVNTISKEKQTKELIIEIPNAVNTDLTVKDKPIQEYATDFTKLFASVKNCEMEPIIKNEIPEKPQKLYFSQLGCEWIKIIRNVLDVEGQYAWLEDRAFLSGQFLGISCVDLRNDKTVWSFGLSDNTDLTFVDENNSKITLFESLGSSYYVYDDQYFIITFSFRYRDGEKTIFGPVDKYSGNLLWARSESKNIYDFKIMKDANRFVYKNEVDFLYYNSIEEFITLELSSGKELFSTRLELKSGHRTYYSINNHFIIISKNDFTTDTPGGEVIEHTIHHIPTKNGQIYWNVSYFEIPEYKINKMPRLLLNNYIIVPNYSEKKAYFLSYDDGSFINTNNVKLSIEINKALDALEMEESLILNNGENICKYDNGDFSNPVWKYDKKDGRLRIFEKITNNSILLMNEDLQENLSFLSLDIESGTKNWETDIGKYSDFDICFLDSFLLINSNMIDLTNGINYKIDQYYGKKNFDKKLFSEFHYCLTRYLFKFDLPTENKVLIYPPQVHISLDNNINTLDEEKIIFMNTTDKPVEFSLEFSKNDKQFNEYISINPKKFTVEPYAQAFVSVKEIKNPKPKDALDEIILMDWLIIKYNNEERKIMIQINDPQCDV